MEDLDYESPDNKDEIIDLVDLVEKANGSTNHDVAMTRKKAATAGELQSFHDRKDVESTPTSSTERDPINGIKDGGAGRSATRTTSATVKEDASEWDVYAQLSDFFESCDVEASELVEEAREEEKNDQMNTTCNNDVTQQGSGGPKLTSAADNENHILERSTQPAEELSDDLFDDLEEKLEALDEDYLIEKAMEAVDELPDDLFDDLLLESKAPSEEKISKKTSDQGDELTKNLFVDIEATGEIIHLKIPATQMSSSEIESTSKSQEGAWLDTYEYSIRLHAIDKEIAEYQQKIKKLTAEKKEVSGKYAYLNAILYAKDNELKKTVVGVFRKYWSLKVAYMNKGKRATFDENILIQSGGMNILAKVIGTQRSRPPIKFITQLWQDLHFSGLGESADGALILNYDIGNNPRDRAPAYVTDEEELLDNIIFIDTRVLHNLTIGIVENGLSVEEAKKILFKKGRVNLDMSDLAK